MTSQTAFETQNQDTVERLRRGQEEIVRRWAERARREVQAAQGKSELALRDDLPKFLDDLAEALSGSKRLSLVKETDELAKEHGKQRARVGDYSLDQVVAEYRILRQVVIRYLEEPRPLDHGLALLIHAAIDRAIANASVEYASVVQSKYRELASQSSESFRLLVESVKDYAIFMMDPDGVIQTWNPGAERIKGYSAHEIIGKNFSIFYTPEAVARDHPRHELEIAREQGRYEEEGWRVKKDGSRFWANVVISRVNDGEGRHVGFAKVTRDLTERKLLEQAQREEQRNAATENERENFLNLFKEMPELVCILRGPDHVFEYVNDAHVKALGFNATGMPVRKAQPESVEVLGILDEVYRTGKTAVLREVPVTVGDRLRYFNLTYAARKDAEGTINGIMVIGDEITEKIQAREELKNAIHARDEFMSMASHELKSPITTLGLQLHLRQRQIEKSDSQFVDRRDFLGFIEKISRQADRLRRLTDDILDISRISHGKFTLEAEEVDLGELVRDVLDRYSAQLRAAGCKYTATIEDGIHGRWDRYRIEQVLVNLLTNAVRYGAGKPIDISVTSGETTACIIVRDRGIGIEKDKLGLIFEPFERVTTEAQKTGLGLGLYISKQIVQAHGGEIQVESEPGKGSEFVVELPLLA